MHRFLSVSEEIDSSVPRLAMHTDSSFDGSRETSAAINTSHRGSAPRGTDASSTHPWRHRLSLSLERGDSRHVLSEHQGVHKVWGTQLDQAGHYQPIDLQ